MGKRVMVLSDAMGSGDLELGRLLMRNFLYSLARAETLPAAVMFANTGVRLACTGSESLDDLALLEERGVAVRACGTCLDHLGLVDEVRVGQIGTMPESVAALMQPEQVVTIA